jgi:hypothetical protein
MLPAASVIKPPVSPIAPLRDSVEPANDSIPPAAPEREESKPPILLSRVPIEFETPLRGDSILETALPNLSKFAAEVDRDLSKLVAACAI